MAGRIDVDEIRRWALKDRDLPRFEPGLTPEDVLAFCDAVDALDAIQKELGGWPCPVPDPVEHSWALSERALTPFREEE